MIPGPGDPAGRQLTARCPLDDAQAHDEAPASPGWLDRILRGFTNTDASVPAPVPAETFTSEDFRQATEHVLLRQAATGQGVILGRAAVIVLRDRPDVLRVRLDGPVERRVEQAMTLGPIDHQSAEAARRRADRTHAEYARQLYRVDISTVPVPPDAGLHRAGAPRVRRPDRPGAARALYRPPAWDHRLLTAEGRFLLAAALELQGGPLECVVGGLVLTLPEPVNWKRPEKAHHTAPGWSVDIHV